MPYINIKVANNELDYVLKCELVEQITKVVTDVLGKDPATTFVVIEEIGTDNWGVGGKTVTERIDAGAEL